MKTKPKTNLVYFPNDRNPHTAMMGHIESYLAVGDVDPVIKDYLMRALNHINFHNNLSLLTPKKRKK